MGVVRSNAVHEKWAAPGPHNKRRGPVAECRRRLPAGVPTRLNHTMPGGRPTRSETQRQPQYALPSPKIPSGHTRIESSARLRTGDATTDT
jgi:hypothetical protein